MDIHRISRLYQALLLGMAILSSGCSAGQPSIEVAAQIPESSENREALEPKPELVLGVGDEIKVTVWRKDDLTHTLRIDSSGIIFFPLVGEVQVAGLTVNQVRNKITDGLSRYYSDPQVNVDVTSYRSRRVYVLGEVAQPGSFVIEDSLKVVGAISLARGFTSDANMGNVILIRQGEKMIEFSSLDVERLLEEGDVKQNVFLHKDDIVFVPPTTIANVERFMRRFISIITPIVELERAIIYGHTINDLINGDRQSVVIVN